MNASTAAYAVLGTLIFAIGLCGVFLRRGLMSALVCIGVATGGPLVAIAGFSATGGAESPPYGDAVSLALIATVSAQLLLGVAIALIAWRHEGAASIDDLDEVST